MNLSKTTKEQIVRKIMLDVPEVDYGIALPVVDCRDSFCTGY